MRVRRPENAVPPQDVPRERPDAVEFVIQLDPLPLLDPEVAHDELLPPALLRAGIAANANGERDGKRQALTARRRNGRREDE